MAIVFASSLTYVSQVAPPDRRTEAIGIVGAGGFLGMLLSIESFPSEARGTGSALALMMMDLGMIAGAPVLGQIAEAYGFQSMYAAIGMLIFVTAVAYAYSSIPVWQARNRFRPEIEALGDGEFLRSPDAASLRSCPSHRLGNSEAPPVEPRAGRA